MNQQLTNFIKETSYCLTNYFPLAFCMAICFGFDIIIGILFSCLAMLFSPKLEKKELMPVIVSFLILGSHPEKSFISILVCFIFLIIFSFFYEKIINIIVNPVSSGIMLSGALTTTVLFTTDYFGIGATGQNVSEMIKSYISLGFHPNWRGVLYGTIVLVIIITFPRKFKKLCKTVSASFIALVFTLILNLFLNPSDMISAINEIPQSNSSEVVEYFISRFNFDFECILIGFALFIIYINSTINDINTKQKDIITCGLVNVVSSGLIGLPLPYGINKSKINLISRLISIVLILVLFFVFKDFFYRIPIHSCAVVIIVTAWESINWREIKKNFSGIIPFIFFILTILLSLYKDMVYGVIFSVILFMPLIVKRKIKY